MENDKYTPPETTKEKSPHDTPLKRPSKTVLIKVGILVVLAGILLLAVSMKQRSPQQKIYGQVGSHKIYQSELDETSQGTSAATKDQVLAALMDKWLFSSIGKEQGISVSNDEINNEYLSRGGGKPSAFSEKYIKVTVERDLYRNKLKDALKGYYKGKFITARFDEHLPVVNAPRVRGEPVLAAAERDELIAKDKAYAEDLINSISKKIASGEINFDQAIELQKNDPKLGTKAQPTSPHSGEFNTSDDESYITVILAQSDANKIMTGLKAGNVSKPFIGKVPLSDAKNPPLADGAWIILKVDEVRQKISGFNDFDSLVASYKNKLVYKVIK